MASDQVKRRLLTILAADVAGFSRLVSEDEEGTLRQLNACLVEFQARIRAHDGRLVKTAGDGLLASFESPVEALRCAIELQRGFAGDTGRPRGLRFRMGLNLGDVLVQEGDLLGDAVNVAARLEGQALPGGICLSAAVHDLVVGKVDAMFDDLGDQTLRNIPRPVRVYCIAGLGRKDEPEPPRKPLEIVRPPPIKRAPSAEEIVAEPRLTPARGAVGDLRALEPDEVRPARRRGVSVLTLSLVLAAIAAAVAGGLVLMRTMSVDEIEAKLGTAPPKPAAPAPAPAPAPTAAQPVAVAPPQPAAPPIPPHKLFAAEAVPFVPDAVRQRLQREYAAGAAPKALAISRGNGTAWFVTAQISEDEARRQALATCVRSAPEPCEVYAVGDRIVSEKGPPPMPVRPYVPPANQRYTLPFAPERVPLAGPGMRDRLRAEYDDAAAFKAVAVARTGTVGFSTSRATEDEAVRTALETCGDLAGSACAVVAVGDSIVAPFPETTTVTGLFDPAGLPLPPADRDRVAQAYAQGGGWKALALDRAGKVGMALNRASEPQATQDALAECRAQGGQDCLVQAIGVFAVIGR